jgi:septum formation protein
MVFTYPPLILGSGSPRRRQIMQDAGFQFTVKTKDTEESFPEDMLAEEVPVLLAERKAEAFKDDITNEIIITADTVVIIENKILNKPADENEAFEMLSMLSGKKHDVITGVCLLSKDKKILFSDKTEVFFRELSAEEIRFYIAKHQPFDKAGAYGTQEWMGMIGIDKIIGSHFNVMGLPVHKVYLALQNF